MKFLCNIRKRLSVGAKVMATVAVMLLACPTPTVAQEPTKENDKNQQTEKKRKRKEPVAVADFTKGWEVRTGGRVEVEVRTPEQDSLEAAEIGRLIDSLVAAREKLLVGTDSLAIGADSLVVASDSLVVADILAADSEGLAAGSDSTVVATDSPMATADSLAVAADSLNVEAQSDSLVIANLTRRIDSLRAQRAALLPTDSTTLKAADSTAIDSTALKPRYNWLFRDSLSLSLTTAASVVLPGFAQLYEEQYWKIPVQYATVGLTALGGIRQNNLYKSYKAEFDRMVNTGASQTERTAVQTQMLKHKSYRTLFYGAAVASFMGFLVDGVMNFPDKEVSHIAKASTLSMVCPGAGQIYNGSYWKVPIVAVGLASMVYVIDWNQRGYSRFQQAYIYATDDDDSTVSEFPSTSVESLRSIRNSYRRNRDLAIIGTVAVYLVQVADAHIDAHMQAYDISDNLAMKIEPHITQTTSPNGITNNYGLNLSIHF